MIMPRTRKKRRRILTAMITDQDVEKLEGTFATKAELADVKADVSVLKDDVSVLKDDVAELKQDVAVLKEDVAELKQDVGDLIVKVVELDDKFDVMSDKMDSMLVSMDTLTGYFKDSMQEHVAGASIMARHDRQIQTLAAASGVALPD